ncbi:MAG: tetratricopeptide repeat protein [Acidobacteria bacterium]|nr:tetratricopeptide repeat protein [Acidobacteriota bacterium]
MLFAICASRWLALLVVSLSLEALAFGQSPHMLWGAPSSRNPVQGEITGLADAHRLFVELADPVSHVISERVPVNVNGSFRFYSPAPETGFEIRIVNESHDVLQKEWVSAGTAQFPVSIPFKTQNGSPQLPGGSISAYRLSHKVPKKAMQEFVKAEQAYKKKHIDEALDHLRKAVSIDAGFVEALNNLGGRLMEKDEPAEAAVFFRRAAELDTSNSTPLLNLGLALIVMGQPAEAERIARRALAIDRGSERAGRVLNLSLRAQGKQAPVSSFR